MYGRADCGEEKSPGRRYRLGGHGDAGEYWLGDKWLVWEDGRSLWVVQSTNVLSICSCSTCCPARNTSRVLSRNVPSCSHYSLIVGYEGSSCVSVHRGPCSELASLQLNLILATEISSWVQHPLPNIRQPIQAHRLAQQSDRYDIAT